MSLDHTAVSPNGDHPEHELQSIDRVLPTGDPLPREHRTELGYAHRFVAAYGDRLRFVATWSAGHQWLVWDGHRWAPDTTGQAKRWMKIIARTVTTEALAISDSEHRKQAVKEAKRGESSSAVNGALTLASIDKQIVVSHDELDADPWLLNTPSGTVNLRTGKLRAHDPDDLITKVTLAAFEADTTGDKFPTFLSQIQPDSEMREFLARLLGHALVGQLIEHVLPIFYGEGANGKSTLLEVVMDVLGDYAAMAAPGLLTARNFDAHPTIADLFGLRLAGLDETDDGRRLAEGTVKRLTGDSRQKARRMRENYWEFEASHTFVMLTNYKPIVNGTDEGIWRRLRLVPFDVVIPKEERDEQLKERLLEEAPYILAWLVNGCVEWRQRRSLDEPNRVMQATDSYRAESDHVRRFLAEQCVVVTGAKVQSSQLYEAWKAWCLSEGVEAGSQRTLTASLLTRGLEEPVKSNGRKVWRGLGLASDASGPGGGEGASADA